MTAAGMNIRALKASIVRDSYLEFFDTFWHTTSKETLVMNWHIEVIAEELQKVGKWIINGEPKEYDLLINVPPGSSKSTLCTILFPIWIWVNAPEKIIISGSYDSRLSTAHAAKSRGVINAPLFQELFGDIVKIHPGFDQKTNYMTTAKGERIVTSSGKSIIGSHAHAIIVDDPIDPKGTKSELVMESIDHWVEVVLPTRTIHKENTPIIMIMQRLHEADPAGVWLKKSKEDPDRKVKHICLPATTDYDVQPKELEDKYVDGLLDPIRMPRRVLKAFKSKMGSIEYAGQFGQSPRAAGGNIVKASMLPVVKWAKLPERIGQYVMDFTVDASDKEKKENDPTGFLAYKAYEFYNKQGIRHVYVFIYDFVKLRARFSKRVEALKLFVEKWGSANSMIYIEPASSGVAMQQHLSDIEGMNAVEWEMTEGDKVRRLQSITPFLEVHKVWLVEGYWNQDFIDQVTAFPNVKHDEEVDCLVMATVNGLIRGTMSGYGFYE